MADRVLPSREPAQEAKDEGNWAGTAFALQEAYISGQLFDREAIDYEAGLAYVVKIWTMVYGDAPSQQVLAILWDGIQGGVDAALGAPDG